MTGLMSDWQRRVGEAVVDGIRDENPIGNQNVLTHDHVVSHVQVHESAYVSSPSDDEAGAAVITFSRDIDPRMRADNH